MKRRRIHEGLVGDRALVGSRYLADPELRRQYAEEIAPRTGAALGRILPAIPAARRALDLGAGTGAGGAALRERFPGVEVLAVDRIPAPGIIAHDVTRGVRPPGVTGRFDVVLAAHLLNELALDLDRRAALVAGWCDELLEPDGWCVLVEPALRETSRALLGVRDRLPGRGLHVVAPCLHQAPCPALARERDWCHDSGATIAAGRSRVDFSYLVLRRGPAPAQDPRLYRIVSDPMREKGKLRLWGCGPAGRHALVRLDRDRSPENAAFDELARGDLLRVEEGTATGDGVRVAQLRRG